jgi:hypothetical protein
MISILRWVGAFFLVGSACAAEMVQLAVKSTGAANYQSFTSPESIVLRAGDSAEILGFSTYPSSPLRVTILGADTNPELEVGFTVVGPATLKASTYNSGSSGPATVAFVSAKVRRFDDSPQAVGNSVVIPEQAGGQFQVILESSTDMVTWTAANPGAYGGDTAKRFFRVRCVRQ